MNRWECIGAFFALVTILTCLGGTWVAGESVAPFGPAADVEPVQDPVPCDRADVLSRCLP